VEQLPILRAYPEIEDVPEDRPVSVYSLNEIATEKIVALQDRVKTVPNQIGSEDGKIAHRQLFRRPQYDNLVDARLYSRREPPIFSSESRCYGDQVF
jgi:hypothetical protein